MHTEETLLPISALQHLVFCERQWALIHLEQQWEENPLTLKGRFLHENVEIPGTESRGDLRVTTALPLRSLELGLVGKADRVEFHRSPNARDGPADDSSPTRGVTLPGIQGRWRPVPVEYKHGKPKQNNADAVQLCAQALCLEEMLDTDIPEGLLYYGKTRKRHEIEFTDSLREETRALARRLHALTAAGQTPVAKYQSKCDACSLFDRCLPKVTGRQNRVGNYLQRNLAQLDSLTGDDDETPA